MTKSRLSFILLVSQPNEFGYRPCNFNLDADGSYNLSSLPETLYPIFFSEMAKLCITLPPIDIKCTLPIKLKTIIK